MSASMEFYATTFTDSSVVVCKGTPPMPEAGRSGSGIASGATASRLSRRSSSTTGCDDMKHRWYATKFMPGFECSTCRRHVYEREDGECLAAHHADKEINKLYRARRKAAEAANESGWKAIKGWDDLNAITARLREVDPYGDWYYEGDRYDGLGWRVMRSAGGDGET